MRKRKRRDTIIRQYKYSVSTDLRPMPNEIWDIAQRMQQAWNALIVAYADSNLAVLDKQYKEQLGTFKARQRVLIDGLSPELRKAYRLAQKTIFTNPVEHKRLWEELIAKPGLEAIALDVEAYKKEIQSLQDMKTEIWKAWDITAKITIAPFGLDYSQGPNVIERFNGCIKANRTCYTETNDPTQLQHVQIPFIFPGSAAIPVPALYNSTRRWRIVIENHSEAMFENNSHSNRRKRRLLYLELGVSKDLSIPLRLDLHRPLPKDGSIKRVLLCGKKMPFRGWRWYVLFQVEIPVSQTPARTKNAVSLRICWTYLDASIVVAQWKNDADQQGILRMNLDVSNRADRRTLKHRPHWNDWLTDYRFLPAWKEAEFALPIGSERRMKMRERRRRIQERWQAQRRWLYYNFANWLVREYAVIRLPDLDIKAIAEDDTKTGALAAGDHWRQIAAPGDLLTIIKETAQKYSRAIEQCSQTSSKFQALRGDGISLRSLQEQYGVQLFNAAWNSNAVARGVHVG